VNHCGNCRATPSLVTNGLVACYDADALTGLTDGGSVSVWPDSSGAGNSAALSAGLPVPVSLLIHGFITSGGKKLSKSTGVSIDPLPLIDKYGADAIRYFLIKEIPTTDDGDFTESYLQQVIAADLANDYGNLVSRVWSMVQKYCAGVVPCPKDKTEVRDLQKLLKLR